MVTAFEGYPQGAFGEESLKAAMGEFDFLPSAAKLVKLIDPFVDRLRSDMRALQRIVDWTPPAPEPPPAPPTEAESVAVSGANNRQMLQAMVHVRQANNLFAHYTLTGSLVAKALAAQRNVLHTVAYWI